MNVPFDRGYGSVEFRSADDLLSLKGASLPPIPVAPFPKVTRDIPAMSADGARPVNIDLVTTKDNGMMAFDIKGGPFWRGTSVKAALGETQLWTIKNNAVWAHPIHLHGFFFQEIDDKGNPVSPRAWKDTIHVAAESTKRFLVKLRPPRIVDVSLPHPRPRRGGADEHGGCRRRHVRAARGRTQTLELFFVCA